jgi:hypothetical protein
MRQFRQPSLDLLKTRPVNCACAVAWREVFTADGPEFANPEFSRILTSASPLSYDLPNACPDAHSEALDKPGRSFRAAMPGTSSLAEGFSFAHWAGTRAFFD